MRVKYTCAAFRPESGKWHERIGKGATLIAVGNKHVTVRFDGEQGECSCTLGNVEPLDDEATAAFVMQKILGRWFRVEEMSNV